MYFVSFTLDTLQRFLQWIKEMQIVLGGAVASPCVTWSLRVWEGFEWCYSDKLGINLELYRCGFKTSFRNTWRKEGSEFSFGLILFLLNNHMEGCSGQSCCR